MYKKIVIISSVIMLSTVTYASDNSSGNAFVQAMEKRPHVNKEVERYLAEKYPLHAAVRNASVPLVQELLDAKISVNATNKEGQTALWELIITQDATQRLVKAQFLLERKANANYIAHDGNAFCTVLQKAVDWCGIGDREYKSQYLLLATMLVEKGNAKIEDGEFNPGPTKAEQQKIIEFGKRLLMPDDNTPATNNKGDEKKAS